MASSGCHKLLFLSCFYLIFSVCYVYCWDTDDLELFDLVEEVNGNFYELLDVSQSATSSEIRKAYRKKTLVLHPDKNDAPDAEDQFRKLVAVYETLKDEEKREKYNQVLINGLPDWRQPVFYYRKARKLGLAELFLVLCLVITVGQYFTLWAVYLERRLALEDFFQSKKKREKKGKKKAAAINDKIEEDMEKTLQTIDKPRLSRLWPVTLTVWLVRVTVNLPTLYRERQERIEHQQEMVRLEELELLELEQQAEMERQELELRRQKRKARQETEGNKERVISDVTPVMYGQTNMTDQEEENDMKQTLKEGSWRDEDFVMLSKAYIRFPGGTSNRWEKIAEMVNRPVNEVISNCKTMKGNFTMKLSSSVQAGTKRSKENVDISDKIISTQDTEIIGKPLNDPDTSDTKLRKRTKNKPSEEPDRALIISKPPDNKTNSKISSQNNNSKQTVIGKENQSKLVNGASNDSKLVEKGKITESSANAKSEANKATTDEWSQNQQAVLEWALRKHPKGTDQRWERVAEHITGKTKEDCILRFKHLAELIKQKKQQKS